MLEVSICVRVFEIICDIESRIYNVIFVHVVTYKCMALEGSFVASATWNVWYDPSVYSKLGRTARASWLPSFIYNASKESTGQITEEGLRKALSGVSMLDLIHEQANCPAKQSTVTPSETRQLLCIMTPQTFYYLTTLGIRALSLTIKLYSFLTQIFKN